MAYAIGVDLGGSKILTALVDESGRVTHRQRVPTPREGPAAGVESIVGTVATVLQDAGVRPEDVAGMCVGAPGPLDPYSGVVLEPPNLVGWHNVPLARMLAARLPMPVRVEHDANATALAEWWIGAGRGVADLIYLTVSTGIGGGIIIDNTLVQGVGGTAGEVGHMTIDINGPRCGCGRLGHLEALAAGPAIARMTAEAVAAGRQTAALTLAGGDPSRITAEIVDDAARRVWQGRRGALDARAEHGQALCLRAPGAGRRHRPGCAG